MARITYGALITDIAGSIGGITFQKNSSGAIARLKPYTPVNPSQLQSNQHIKLQQLNALWPTLSYSNHADWNNFAAAHNKVNEWSEIKSLNGFQWFMSCNLNLLLVGENAILVPPSWSVLAPPSTGSIARNSASLNIRWIPNCNFTPNYIALYVSNPLQHTSIKLKKSFFLANITKNLAIGYWNITSYWESVNHINWTDFYTNAISTYMVRVKIIQSGTGLASPYLSLLDKIN